MVKYDFVFTIKQAGKLIINDHFGTQYFHYLTCPLCPAVLMSRHKWAQSSQGLAWGDFRYEGK